MAEDGKKEVIPTVVFVLGGPGAGKGTQCENIVKHCEGWGHISAGDCLREEKANPDSPDGKLINERIKEGKIVPAEITVRLMLKKMKSSEGKTKFLIDGFPRNQDNVDTWEKEVGKSARVKGVFFFDTTEQVMEERLLERGKTSGRSDDNIEAIRKRFKTYVEESYPIIEQYKKKGLAYRIDSTIPAEDVWKIVQIKVRDVEAGRKPIRLRVPKFGKVSAINPDSRRANLKVKVTSLDTEPEVTVGDESGSVVLRLQEPRPSFVQVGASLRVQNATVRMMKGFIRIDVNKWAKVALLDEALDFEPNAKNISAVEYELAGA